MEVLKALIRYIPPLALMALIYVLSDRPGLGTGLGSWDTILRKLAHMVEFGVLWWLWWNALARRTLWIPALITVAYAISDEIHQHFVRDRNGAPIDVVIDTVGIALAMALTAWWTGRAPATKRSGHGSHRS